MAAPARQLFNVASMLEPVAGVSDVRIVNPLRALSAEPGIATRIVVHGTVVPDPPPEADRICILHRPILVGERGLTFLRQLLDKNYTVITEFDDNPCVFPAMRDLRAPDQFTFRGVHALQTSTKPLAELLLPSNPQIAVFPNTMMSMPEPANFTEPGRLTLFFGALNRQRDWAPFVPALNTVAARLGERLRFRIVHDEAFFTALETPHKTFLPTCDYHTYLRLLGECEISFMPLADTAFNRAKSDLKFIEAGACRVAPLASPVVYAAAIKDRQTGLLFRDPAELQARLMQLLETPDLARCLGENARSYVAEHRMFSAQIKPRLDWYRSLVARRADLTRALLARVPELAAPSPSVAVRPRDLAETVMPVTNGPDPAPAAALHALASPDLGPLFWRPSRQGVPSAWHGHVPFAHWVVHATRPRVLVELGSHAGVSYSAFCNAVQQEALPARCFAVDTWRGDEHAGFYAEAVFTDFKRFHDAHYAGFSRMLRCTFDEALPQFAEGSIDLLHIDGRHGYDDVRSDFHSWLPKLSPRAVVLFHDTNERARDFGVWRLWAELREAHPGFEFTHEHGLGVLAVGSVERPPAIAALCGLPEPDAAMLRGRFAALGERMQLMARLEAQQRHTSVLEQRMRVLQARHEEDQAFIRQMQNMA